MSKPIFQYPEKEGEVEISISTIDEDNYAVSIVGNPKGLKYLGNLLIGFADYIQNESTDKYDHIHLHPNLQLNRNSCEVAIGNLSEK